MKRRQEAEYAKMMAEYQQKEELKVTDDGAKNEIVQVSVSKPLSPKQATEEKMVTVQGEDGSTVSYPQRSFKPEQPKTEETVTLMASSDHEETHTMGNSFGWLVLSGMGMAMMVSMTRKTW